MSDNGIYDMPIPDEDRYVYIITWSETDQCFVAYALGFRHIEAHGDTDEEALRECSKAVRAEIDRLTEAGEEVPKPASTRGFSGKYALRMPPSLHKRLTIEAAEQGVSLNKWINYKLSS